MLNALIALYFGFLAPPIYAQAPAYKDAYQNYLVTYTSYQQAHSDYDIARSQYLASNTISSQTRAQQATAAMLTARDQATIVYLTALKARLNEAAGVNGADKQALFSLADTEIAWYSDHQNKIDSAGSLDDQVSDSNLAMNQFKRTQILIYKMLITISIGFTTDYRNRDEQILSDLRSEISNIKANGDKNTDSIERALLDAEDRLSRSSAKEQDALATISKMQIGDDNKLSTFNTAELTVGEGLSYVKEANGIVKDSIGQIKTAD